MKNLQNYQIIKPYFKQDEKSLRKLSHKNNYNFSSKVIYFFCLIKALTSSRKSNQYKYLGLGKCESQDFDAQIAKTTLTMIQYNCCP